MKETKRLLKGLEKFNCLIEENKSKNINNSKKIKIADEQARFGYKGQGKIINIGMAIKGMYQLICNQD